jgi:hypothetical protein
MRRGPTKRHVNHNVEPYTCPLCRFKTAKADGRDKRWWNHHLKLLGVEGWLC